MVTYRVRRGLVKSIKDAREFQRKCKALGHNDDYYRGYIDALRVQLDYVKSIASLEKMIQLEDEPPLQGDYTINELTTKE